MTCINLKVNPNCSNLRQFKRRFLAYQLAFVPGYLHRFAFEEWIHKPMPNIS